MFNENSLQDFVPQKRDYGMQCILSMDDLVAIIVILPL